MDKGKSSPLFVNDGSFMERFMKLQQEKKETGTLPEDSQLGKNSSGSLTPNVTIAKTASHVKADSASKPGTVSSSGKLAFSLKQKPKLAAAPVKLGADDDEDEGDGGSGLGDGPTKRQKLDPLDASYTSSVQKDVAPPAPSDPTVKKVADKLASFVAKNGRQFETITRQRNTGDTPFKFLFDKSCADYKYYEFQLIEEEKILAQNKDPEVSHAASTGTSVSRTAGSYQRTPRQQQSDYQIPASALYDCREDIRPHVTSHQAPSVGNSSYGEYNPPSASDPLAMMEFYAKKAAHEERRKQPKQSKDEMPPPASLQGPGPGKKGHHMGDYIPQDELEKFLASCNDAAAQKAAKEAAERSKIQADNVGHKLLSKMGWKEGEGLGSSKSGRADPVSAGNVKLNNLGVGAEHPAEVTPEDDIYEQYKKRMMLGYRYRPNPLNNPRKAYY